MDRWKTVCRWLVVGLLLMPLLNGMGIVSVVQASAIPPDGLDDGSGLFSAAGVGLEYSFDLARWQDESIEQTDAPKAEASSVPLSQAAASFEEWKYEGGNTANAPYAQVDDRASSPIHAPGFAVETSENVFALIPARIGSDYGPRDRSSGSYWHKGIDIPVGLGTPVYAVADGTIATEPKNANDETVGSCERLNDDGVVTIDHGTWQSRYIHLLSWAEARSIYNTPGRRVEAGQLIGYSGGRRGTSEPDTDCGGGTRYKSNPGGWGYHLHFDLGINQYDNPLGRLRYHQSLPPVLQFMKNAATENVKIGVVSKPLNGQTDSEYNVPIGIASFGVRTGLNKDLQRVEVQTYDRNGIREVYSFTLDYDAVLGIGAQVSPEEQRNYRLRGNSNGRRAIGGRDQVFVCESGFGGVRPANPVPTEEYRRECVQNKAEVGAFDLYVLPGWTDGTSEDGLEPDGAEDWFYYMWHLEQYTEPMGPHTIIVTATDVMGNFVTEPFTIGTELKSQTGPLWVDSEGTVTHRFQVTKYDYDQNGTVTLHIDPDWEPNGWSAHLESDGVSPSNDGRSLTLHLGSDRSADVRLVVTAPKDAALGTQSEVQVLAQLDRIEFQGSENPYPLRDSATFRTTIGRPDSIVETIFRGLADFFGSIGTWIGRLLGLIPGQQPQQVQGTRATPIDVAHADLLAAPGLPPVEAVPLSDAGSAGTIPFTSEGLVEALGLDTLFDESLVRQLEEAGPLYANLAQLEEAISGAGGTYGGVELSFTDVGVARNAVNEALIDVDLTLKATRTISPALSLSGQAVSLTGGSLPIALQLSARFDFQMDTTQSDPGAAFYLLQEPVIHFGVQGTGTVGEFGTRLGFTDVDVSGTLALDYGIDLKLQDPDGAGRFTQDEWTTTAPEDLIDLQISQHNAISLTLGVDSDLIYGGPDGKLTFTDSNLADGFSPGTSGNLGHLPDFLNVTADEVLAGLSRFAAGLIGTQHARDLKLPFLQQSLGDVFLFAQPLIDVVWEQGDADILCGAEDTNPPGGPVAGLPPDSVVYCRAYALSDAQSVSWSGAGAELIGGGTVTATVGPNPSSNAAFRLAQSGTPDLRVEYTDASGVRHAVSSRFETAQGLLEKLRQVGGFGDVQVLYYPITRSLTYRLHKLDEELPPFAQAQLDFGDQLKEATYLRGLSPTGNAAATVKPRNVELDVVFGILLGDDVAEDQDRFFIQAPNEALFKADAAVSATVELEGRLGYVEVGLAGTGFEVRRSEALSPMLSVNLDAPAGITVPGGGEISHAVTISQLLSNVPKYVRAACNVQMSSDLTASASLGDASLGQGGVELRWPQVFDTDCLPNLGELGVAPVDGFAENLMGLDLRPSLFGTHTEVATSTTVLADSGQDFLKPERSLEGATLKNLTDGSRCTVKGVDAKTATCTVPLEGGLRNEWRPGDRYEIEGDPLAMLSAILDNLDQLVAQLGSFEADGLATSLPLVGLSPGDLMQRLADVSQAIEKIRSGAPEAVLLCGTQDANPPEGDPSQVTAGSLLYCQAVAPDAGAVSSAAWQISSGTTMTNAEGAGALSTVGPNPSANAVFEVGDVTGNDLRVTLSFEDAQGSHSAAFPSLAFPTSLQELEQLLESKLDIPPDALQIALDDLPLLEGGAGMGVKDLVFRLGYGVCTEGNGAIHACQPVDKQVPKPGIPLNLDMSGVGLPGLVGLDKSLGLEYAVRTQLGLGISLEETPQVVVLGSSGVTMEVGLSAEDLSMRANVGPLSLDVGKDAVKTGKHSGSEDAAKLEDSSADFIRLGVQSGDTVLNLTDEVACVVAGVTEKTLTCKENLPNEHTWAEGDEYQVGRGGVVRLGVGFTLLPESAKEVLSLDGFVGDLTAELDGLDDLALADCPGDACAVLSLMGGIGPARSYLGDLKFSILDIKNPNPVFEGDLSRLEAVIDTSELDWILLLEALPEILTYVEDNLHGAASVPVVGDQLDAGADVAATLRDEVVQPFNDEVLPYLKDVTRLKDVPTLEKTLQISVTEAIQASGLLQGDVQVTAYCDDGPCGSSAGPKDVDDVRLTFTLGRNAEYELPFDVGIPGVPIRTSGAARSEAEWSVLLDFGLSRSHGPYLVVHDTSGSGLHPEGPELALTAEVSLAHNPEAQAECDLNDPEDPEHPVEGEYSNERCVAGTLGFLYVTLRDGNGPDGGTSDEPTHLALNAGLDLTSGGSEPIGRIGYRELTSGAAGAILELGIDANVDLRFRTGVRNLDGVPSVAGAFHLDWAREYTLGGGNGAAGAFRTGQALQPGGGIADRAAETRPLDITFDNLYLDLGSFVSQFLSPVAKQVKEVTGPFMPVIDTVRAPLPVLSDLSRMVGGGDISLIALMQQASETDLTMMERVIDLVVFANEIPDVRDDEVLWIPLGNGETKAGSFGIDPQQALKGPVTPGQELTLIKDAVAVEADKLREAFKDKPKPGSDLDSFFKNKFEGGGFAFPFLQQPSKIFGMLMGQDVVLVHYDAGTMRATAGVSYKFRFAVGPVPMSVELSGSATLEGRFAMGYDTYGMRQAMNGGGAAQLIDGLYIDDLDASGADVPEIRLIGTIRARAAVDLVVVSAGVGGGIELTVNLDLVDPNADGKLRLDEVYSQINNPWCLFSVDGKLEAFLEAFVKIDFFFFSKTYTFDLARITLLDFSARCSPPKPVLAVLGDMNGDGIEDLILNIGPRAKDRNILTDKEDEKVVVRQLDRTGTRVSVSAFGIQQEYSLQAGAVIWAEAGTGQDDLSLEPGVENPGGETIPFTIRGVLYGGEGSDQIRTGWGDDEVHGGAGNDKINASDGADTVYGDDGNDALDGGIGDDWVYGGIGDDRINGGSGADHLYGDEGDDAISGGPGSNQSVAAPGPNPDLGDWLYGGAGNDTLQGGWGDDVLYGDEDLGADPVAACAAVGGVAGDDHLAGGYGSDQLFGGDGRDVASGGPGDDRVCGNGGDDVADGDDDDARLADGADTVFGGDGADVLYGRGGNDVLQGGNGPDDLLGGGGRDHLSGGDDNDILLGDEGTIAEHEPALHAGVLDEVLALVLPGNAPAEGAIDCANVGAEPGNADCLYGGEGQDYLFGEGGHDRVFGEGGDDYLEGNAGDDYMEGNHDADTMRGGRDADTMHGNAGSDTMYGDSGSDLMFGGTEDDLMRGGMGDDDMEGNQGADTMYGDADQDDMIGGSSAPGTADDRDVIYGNAGQDVIAGDNALLARPGSADSADGTVVRTVTLLDLDAADPDLSGDDEIYGNEGNDDIYGGGDDDVLHGNEGDDYIEGNNGGDQVYGDAGQDDLIGGTSQDGGGHRDGRDRIWGGIDGDGQADDHDVIAGDNASIARPAAGGRWIRMDLSAGAAGVVRRAVELYDVATVHSSPAAGASGGDWIYGEAGMDTMYGQGGDDELYGGAGDDDMQGNAGRDELNGGAGSDDMTGGTGRINNDPETGTDGRLDGGDTMEGGPGFDVMAGDNAIIARTIVDGHWVGHTFNGGVQHERIHLLDVDSGSSARVSDRDVMYGGGDDDVLYGQGGRDEMHGGAGDDYMEGNAEADTMRGDAGQDDMIGGTGLIGNDPPWGTDGRRDSADLMYGERDPSPGAPDRESADVMLGDNGIIVRPLAGDGSWRVNGSSGAVVRDATRLDVETTDHSVRRAVYGDDRMWGNDGHDVMYGQSGQDEMHGGAGDDYMEGNAASDSMYGDGQDDDMLGGSGPITSGDPSTARRGLVDASTRTRRVPLGSSPAVAVPLGDTMYGGGGADVMLGDNGIIARSPNRTGPWRVLRYASLESSDGYGAPRHTTRGTSARVDRDVEMIDVTPGRTAGSDLIYGGPGDDDLYGQFDDTNAARQPAIGDELLGESGEDALVGDQGLVDSWVVDSPTRSIRTNKPNIDDHIFVQGTLFREVTLLQIAAGGHDRLVGGTDGDWMHGGAGDDLMNGNGGNDRLFGDDGSDVIWGGPHHDHLWGGSGDDYLDVKPRSEMTVDEKNKNKKETFVQDPLEWFVYGDQDHFQDVDYIYGGWDQDAMQADVADTGPVPGDRMIDWAGAYNVYYLCPGLYGGFVITRGHGPDVVAFLQDLATGDGAVNAAATGSSGFQEIAIVFSKDIRYNSHPPHPDHPGHFTCSD